ncbi:MAG: DegT/DnrJ/EryC1/StrS aminotransferase family protein [Opitutae bacterium]|nr:DegT/DnrJ/EryC1/StrS aminotransferase family protein [Opitutae bacterium]
MPRLLTSRFVLNPCEFQLPAYRISPFTTSDLERNASLPPANQIDSYFAGRYPTKRFIYTENGRDAIRIALRTLKLSREDCVTIFTTTGNHYVSGCVTKEIEKVCRWSRRMERDTKAIFVNHEFGFAFDGLAELRSYGLPIIEDICHSFVSRNAADTVGRIGDFVVASFPKFFPIQCGGGLWHAPDFEITEEVSSDFRNYCRTVLSHYCSDIAEIAERRRENHRRMAVLFGDLALPARFCLSEGDVPGVFMFRVPEETDLLAMKGFMAHHGVQGGGFHTEMTYFVPVHQRMTALGMSYIADLANCYLHSTESHHHR